MNILVKVDDKAIGPVSKVPTKGSVAHAIWKCLMRERGCTMKEATAAARRAGATAKDIEQYVRIIMSKLKKNGWELMTIEGPNKTRYKVNALYPTVEAKRGRPKGSKNRPRPSIAETKNLKPENKPKRKAQKKVEPAIAA